MKTVLISIAILVFLAFFGWFLYFLFLGSRSATETEQKTALVAEHQKEYELAESSRIGFVDASQDYGILAKVSVKWDRPHPGPFNWQEIGLKKYDFCKVDEYVKQAQAYGFVTLATIWPFNSKDQETCHSNLPKIGDKTFPQLADRAGIPCDLSSYKDFVRSLVERYDGDGVDDYENLKFPINYWEVTNEPDMRNGDLIFFQGSVADYAELVKITYQSIKQANLNAKVLLGGASGLSNPEQTTFWSDFFATSGIENYFDILNIHSINASKNLFVSDFFNLARTANKTEKVAKAPLWVTEVSFDYGQSQFGNVDQTGQANLIKTGFVLGFAQGATKIFYTILKSNDQKLAKAALITPDDQITPAWTIFSDLVSKINHFTKVEKISDNQYKFLTDQETYWFTI